jgi:hypothetical protein
MRKLMRVIAIANALNAQSLVFAQVSASPAPLSVSGARVVGDTGTLHADVTNRGSKTAVAWALDSTLVFADGHTETLSTDEDCYPQLVVPAAAVITPLRPGETKTMPLFAAAEAPVSIDVSSVAVVYADRTAEGNPDRIKRIVQRRADDAKSWQDVPAILRQTLLQRGL